MRDENWMDTGYLETISRRCSLLGCGEGKQLAGATVGVGWGGVLLRVACPKEVDVQSKVRQKRERAFLILQP